MSTLVEEEEPKNKGQQRFGNTNAKGKNTLEEQISSWYKPPTLKTVLTDELAREIAECFLDGLTDEETGIICDVEENTIRNWRRLSPIKKHETARKRFYIHEIRDGKRRDWTRLAWWLERRWPLEFSRPEVAHEIQLSQHNTVNTTQNLIVSAELAEQLAERNKSVASQIERLFANVPNQCSGPIIPIMSPAQQTPPSSAGYVQAGDVSNSAKVREIAASITTQDDVMGSDDKSSIKTISKTVSKLSPGGASEVPSPGTPAVGPGPTTDQPARTRDSKNQSDNSKNQSDNSKNQPKNRNSELEIKKLTAKKSVTPGEKLAAREKMMAKIVEKRKNAKVSAREHLAAKRKMILRYGQH